MSKFIAIIQTGEPIASVLENHGDFDALFIKHMQVDPLKTKTFKVFKSLKFPEVKNLAGIIITGSPAMVTDKLDWSEAIIEWLKQFLQLEIPILGVCYGHQLLARALCGQVDWNPNGRQIGRVQMQLTEAAHSDPVFSNLIDNEKNSIYYHATHLQSVTVLPKEVTLLGNTKLDPNHCFRYKQHIWSTQFHPEFDAGVIQEYIIARSNEIKQEGLDPNKILSNIINNDNGGHLLKRFRDICFKNNP